MYDLWGHGFPFPGDVGTLPHILLNRAMNQKIRAIANTLKPIAARRYCGQNILENIVMSFPGDYTASISMR